MRFFCFSLFMYFVNKNMQHVYEMNYISNVSYFQFLENNLFFVKTIASNEKL